MTYDIEQKIRPELTRDERLLWSGAPQPGLRWRSTDWFAMPFALMWCYLAMFASTGHGVHEQEPPLYMTPAGIPFVLIGFYVLIGRFLVDWYQRRRTFYGVTDQRIIILDGLFDRRVKSLALATLNNISLSERSSGSGSITFGSGASPQGRGRSFFSTANQQAPNFDMIEHVRSVYALIREAQQSNRARGGA